ncbi:unnamed protein product, partial [Heterosigma akashiwo]
AGADAEKGKGQGQEQEQEQEQTITNGNPDVTSSTAEDLPNGFAPLTPARSDSQSDSRNLSMLSSGARKGKWTQEEERYCIRLIQFFNEGALDLPEGAMLRSYLSDKLACDPM